MNDQKRPPGSSGDPEDSDEIVGRLIRQAGARAEAPPEREARVREAVHARWREATLRYPRRGLAGPIGLGFAAAAALAVVAGAGFWLRERIRLGRSPVATVVRAEGRVLRLDGVRAGAGGALEEGAGLVTGPGGRAALRLAEGAMVRVDVDSELRLKASRILELARGTIYVDTRAPEPIRGAAGSGGGARTAAGAVPPRSPAPLEIRTRLGMVSDVGTQFAVSLAGGTLRLDVRSGVATLTSGGRASSAPAGTRLQVGPDGNIKAGTVPIDGEDWSWVMAIAPSFELEGRTLSDYFEWLRRETGWGISFADPSIGPSATTIILHGSTSGLRPDETPDAVLPACGLRSRLEAGRLLIDRARP
jgi:ferric-dicitrate binding protein FerR (iron transport regulator)